MNPLPIINLWLCQHPYHDMSDMPRVQLKEWLGKHFPSCDPDLAADCLIAAGIGQDAEQDKTVYCRATY